MPLISSEESLEVLLVDDELSTREILEQFCRSRNLPVAVASDGRAAITALERNAARFSIVMTDINMPGADGFDVLKAAKIANRDVYVVMITGYATLDSALRAVREGAYDYVAKPFSLGQLDVMLARIKDRIALERENRDLRRRLQGLEKAQKNPAGPTTYGNLAAAARRPAGQATVPSTHAVALRPLSGAVPLPQVSTPASIDQRVTAMEDRLGRMEDLLRRALAAGR